MTWTGTKAEHEAWMNERPKLPPIPRSEPSKTRTQGQKQVPKHLQPNPLPSMNEGDQERLMLWALEKLDAKGCDRKTARGIRDYVRPVLTGDRLAVVEEQAAIVMGTR